MQCGSLPHTGNSDYIHKRMRTKINYKGSVTQDMESVNEKNYILLGFRDIIQALPTKCGGIYSEI